MYNSHRLIAQQAGSCGAVIHKTFKTAPKINPKAEKIQKKVAETAEIPKTAPKPNPKAEKNPEKSS